MITRIKIQNFGSLLDIDVTLGPLTLLVGPNASGKTMFIRALRTFTKLLRSGLRGMKGDFSLDHATLDNLVSFGDASREIRFSVWLGDPYAEPSYELALAKHEDLWIIVEERLCHSGFHFDSREGPLEFSTERLGAIRWQTPGEPPRHATLPYLAYTHRQDRYAMATLQPLLDLQRAVGVTRVFRIGTPNLVRPSLPPWIKTDNPYVDETGSGFIHTLNNFSQTATGRKILDDRIIPFLKELFPHIKDLGFRGGPSFLNLEYESERYKTALPAQLESDGVNLALFFICLPFLLSEPESKGAPIPVCVGLEEPEAGTHPFFQRNRLELFRRLVRPGTTPTPLQIIATTHSIDLLRWVRKEEALDVLRFVEHLGADEGTKIHRLTQQHDLERVYEEYDRNLGLAWYSGALGAVPSWPEDNED